MSREAFWAWLALLAFASAVIIGAYEPWHIRSVADLYRAAGLVLGLFFVSGLLPLMVFAWWRFRYASARPVLIMWTTSLALIALGMWSYGLLVVDEAAPPTGTAPVVATPDPRPTIPDTSGIEGSRAPLPE